MHVIVRAGLLMCMCIFIICFMCCKKTRTPPPVLSPIDHLLTTQCVTTSLFLVQDALVRPTRVRVFLCVTITLCLYFLLIAKHIIILQDCASCRKKHKILTTERSTKKASSSLLFVFAAILTDNTTIHHPHIINNMHKQQQGHSWGVYVHNHTPPRTAYSTAGCAHKPCRIKTPS